ncbi:MAG: cell envelope biogenesis protein OmpA [Alphaproteobacteria bacterium]|nr:MAG: cell envelope biogenesis protein OmpA [Alphaproteobacteria bacterium]
MTSENHVPRKLKLCTATVVAAFLLSSCTTDPYTGEKKASNTAVGAGIGAAVGAIGGAIVGGSNKRKAALIGAGIGALAGGGVGAYMDAQEAKLRKQLQGTGVSVTRDGNNLILNMPGNVTFDVDSASIRGSFYEVLDSVALVLKEYDKTYVDVIGHTDSTGSEAYNQALSESRAASVADYLASKGVIRERLLVRGMGERYPIADNATPEGRQLNRRVEIGIVPVT